MSSEYRSVFSFYECSKHVHKHRGTLNTALHSCCHFTPVNLHDLHGAVLITKPRLPDIRHPDFNWFKKRLQTVKSQSWSRFLFIIGNSGAESSVSVSISLDF